MGIIHMNGRIYDPRLARFLQADPFIQAATDTQSYNRYSYVRNNPLNATDPSGFMWSAFKGLIKSAVKIFGADVVNFIGTVLFAKLGGPYGAAWWSYNFTRAMGGTSSQAWRSASFSFASAAVFTGIGKAFQGTGFMAQGGAGHIFSHAMAGGVLAELQGGKFGNGFFSAGLTKAANISGIMGDDAGNFADTVRTITAAIVGGTISEITGGKFANGAITAAMAQMFNGNKAIQDKADAKAKYEKLGEEYKAYKIANPNGKKVMSQEDLNIIVKHQGYLTHDLERSLNPYNAAIEFIIADTFLWGKAGGNLGNYKFEYNGNIYLGGEINYIAVGMLSAHYYASPTLPPMVITWNVGQYLFKGFESHNITQIPNSTLWAIYGAQMYNLAPE